MKRLPKARRHHYQHKNLLRKMVKELRMELDEQFLKDMADAAKHLSIITLPNNAARRRHLLRKWTIEQESK